MVRVRTVANRLSGHAAPLIEARSSLPSPSYNRARAGLQACAPWRRKIELRGSHTLVTQAATLECSSSANACDSSVCPCAGRCRLRARKNEGYHDIVGDGGSRILEQVAEQRTRITDGLAGVRHLVAVGSGKGGVGKSTLTLHLAGALRARGLRIAILDADFNGPSQARMAGVQGAVFVPPPSPKGFGAASGSHKVALPRTRNGIAVFSMGSLIPESEALEFESAAHGESHTWRATREFALLGEILGAFEWGELDLLMFESAAGSRADRPVRRFSRASTSRSCS